MSNDNSSYPPIGGQPQNLVNLFGLTGHPETSSAATVSLEDPSARSSAVIGMMKYWEPIAVCIAGTEGLRDNPYDLIPQENSESDDAYRRRIFHAVMPPFVQRLASQAAGSILRRGPHLEGGDLEWFESWATDVTGDGTPLEEFCRKTLVDALLFGHSSICVDYSNDTPPSTLAEERMQDRKPYLVSVPATQVRGWRTEGNRTTSPLTMVRYHEVVSVPDGEFGETIQEQIRVLRPGSYQVWRWQDSDPRAQPEIHSGWYLHEEGETSIDELPLVTVYSNRVATLISKPPMVEVAELNISYAQRFCDYYHSLHVGAQPILVLKGFDPENDTELGLSVNTAVLLPPDGDAMYVEPTSAVYESQLRCLQTLEEQIRSLGVSVLARQNITNVAAESKRLDRVDTDSIMAIISQDLARAITDILRIVGKYAGKEPPTVTIPQDYTNRLLDGNQITAMLQLQMQNQISQELLLRVLQEGEVIPAYVDIEEEISLTKDQLDQEFDLQLEQAEAMGALDSQLQDKQSQGGEGGVTTGGAAAGKTKGSNTLATPLRPGKYE